MRRAGRWLVRIALFLVLVSAVAVLLLVAALNTAPGQLLAERATAKLSGGMVTLTGLAGRFPDALQVARLEVRDAKGVWLVAQDVALDWSPEELLSGEAHVTQVSAAEIAVARLPVSDSTDRSASTSKLPVRVVVDALRIDRLAVAAPVAGAAAAVSAAGHATVESLDQGTAALSIRALGGGGSYRLEGHADAAAVSAKLSAEEPAHGLLSGLAGLPDVGAVSLTVSAQGPWAAVATQMALTAGKLTASARGTVNVPGQAADLDVSANAPAMAPRADVSWQAVSLEAHVHGPWTRPRAQGRVGIDGLAAFGAGLHRLSATLAGDLGAVSLSATAEGVKLPGPAPDLFAAAPVTLRADARLDDAARPVTFSLAHPLLSLTGSAKTGGVLSATAHLTVPDLGPLAPLGVPAVQGHAAFDVTAAIPAEGPTFSLNGALGVTGGAAPLPALVGPDAHLSASGVVHGEILTLSDVQFHGAKTSLAAHGNVAPAIDVTWQAELPDLSVLAPSVQGGVQGAGRVHGAPTDMAVEADLTGTLTAPGVPSEPLKLSLAAHGLPDAPAGTIAAEGAFEGAPVALTMAADRHADGGVSLSIGRADWKSFHAEGAVTIAPGADVPAGKFSLRMDRLDDLLPVLGQKLVGSVSAELTAEGAEVRLKATGKNAGLVGTASVAAATLEVRARAPLSAPTLDGSLDLAGISAAGIGGSARIDASGPPSALALKLRTSLTGIGDGPVGATATARLDAIAKTLAVSALQADWKGETLRLLAPSRIAFGDGVKLDRTRLGVRDGVLDVTGRVAPTLDATATLRGLPLDLVRIVMPQTHLAGTLDADAKLSGAMGTPAGRVHLAMAGVRDRDGPGAAMPAATIVADATLAGGAATLTARAAAGKNVVDVSGTAPLDPRGAMNLRATGKVDLAVLDPLLASAGRRARGQVTLDATLGGTPTAPLGRGTLRLADGDVQDIAQGFRISGIDALVEADGDTVRISRFVGRTKGGTITLGGTLGLGGAMPVDVTITGKRAQPLTSDLLTATFDLDLAVRGDLFGALTVGGTVTVDRADINVPERLPAKVAVLNVRRGGQAPPSAPGGPGQDIGLNVTLRAPGQVFIRGRGLDVELQGRIAITGTAGAPVPSGRFSLRRGEVSIAGQTLTFTSGDIGFDGAGGLDPALNLVATSTNGSITATLTITGYASAPKIVLSSNPTLPQDEVLAQLLFHQSASTLSAVQLAQAAVALGQLTGVSGGFDPLASIRASLGLDRLTVGSGSTGNGATVEAGRYVAPGIFVGAKQATGGSGTQATVQIDITRRLKLEATAGTGGDTSATGAATTQQSNGSGIGLTYQFDY
jgi:translocation and assembly module TamB